MEPFFNTPRCRLFLGDAQEVLEGFEDASVDCAVTSPPYYRLGRYNAGGPRDIGREKTPDGYTRRLEGVGRELHRIVRPRGSFWLVIGDTCRDNEWLGVPWRVAFAVRDVGWKIRNEVIWWKAKPDPKGTHDRLGCSHEQGFHFVKGNGAPYDMNAMRKARPLAGSRSTDVWVVPSENVRFPILRFESFPEALVEGPIAATCRPGGVVLDPFIGSGTTAAVALRLGRFAIGIDISEEELQRARRRVWELSQDLAS